MQGSIVGDVNNKRKLTGLLDFQNKRVGVLRMTLRAGKVFGTFGRISGDIILFISSKRWRLGGTKLCIYFYFYSLYNILKGQLYRISRS